MMLKRTCTGKPYDSLDEHSLDMHGNGDGSCARLVTFAYGAKDREPCLSARKGARGFDSGWNVIELSGVQ